MRIREMTARSILTKSGLPASDWVVNPYNGCAFGCAYCYAAQIARWRHPDEEWGSYVDVKMNAPELLRDELKREMRKAGSDDIGSVFFSSVTDPYQGVEGKYGLTGKCLEVLSDVSYGGAVNIQTKSPLVTKDIPVLKRMRGVSVGMTITSLDDRVSRFMECGAPPVSARLSALEKLHREGIPTYAFVGPILPHVLNEYDALMTLLDRLEQSGVSTVWFEHINLMGPIKHRLYEYLGTNAPDLIPLYDNASTDSYRKELGRMVENAMRGRNLVMGMGKVLFHGTDRKTKRQSKGKGGRI